MNLYNNCFIFEKKVIADMHYCCNDDNSTRSRGVHPCICVLQFICPRIVHVVLICVLYAKQGPRLSQLAHSSLLSIPHFLPLGGSATHFSMLGRAFKTQQHYQSQSLSDKFLIASNYVHVPLSQEIIYRNFSN